MKRKNLFFFPKVSGIQEAKLILIKHIWNDDYKVHIRYNDTLLSRYSILM